MDKQGGKPGGKPGRKPGGEQEVNQWVNGGEQGLNQVVACLFVCLSLKLIRNMSPDGFFIGPKLLFSVVGAQLLRKAAPGHVALNQP